MSAKRYTLLMLLGAALVVAAAAATNRVVDPFWYYRDIEIEGFNTVKPRFARYERHVKPQLLARERSQAIVLGSSISEIGFDTNDPSLTAGGALKGYNFAFAGAPWPLVQCHLSYARAVTDLKRVVLGVHLQALPLVDCSNRMPEVKDFSETKLLFSLQALNQSLRTVLEQRRGRSSHTREGRYLYARGDGAVAARFRERLLGLAHTNPRCTLESVPATPPPSRDIAPAFPGSAAGLDLSGLRAAIRQTRSSGIELRIFAYPLHALAWELDLVCGRGTERWAALAAMAQVIAEEAPDGGVQLWMFYDYNDVTGESIAGQPVYWQDSEHFNYEMGTLMLADLFGGAAEGKLGRRVTAGGAADAYRAFLASRDRYIATHPRFYDELRATLAPLR